MNPQNFLKQLGEIPNKMSDGIRRSIEIKLHDLRTSTGLVLDATTTNPRLAALEVNHQGLQFLAGSVAPFIFNFTVPVDYDETADVLDIRVLANSAGNTDGPTLSAQVFRKRRLTALSADLAPAATAAIPKSAAPAAIGDYNVIKVRSKGIKAGDILTITVFPSAHATDAVNVYGIDINFRSTVAAYNFSDRVNP
jgi:hypothetical protein